MSKTDKITYKLRCDGLERENAALIAQIKTLEQSLWSRDKDVEAKDMLIRELESRLTNPE